jgi:hypothetical protein
MVSNSLQSSVDSTLRQSYLNRYPTDTRPIPRLTISGGATACRKGPFLPTIFDNRAHREIAENKKIPTEIRFHE